MKNCGDNLFDEQLEKQYAKRDKKPKKKIVGAGFAKQKQVMEANQYYAGRKRRIVKITDRRKNRL